MRGAYKAAPGQLRGNVWIRENFSWEAVMASKLIILLFMVPSICLSQDKIPLRFPLGLAPGISQDSTLKVLKSKGGKKSHGGIIRYGMNFGDVRTDIILPDYYGGELFSIILETDGLDHADLQFSRISDICKFIGDTYICDVTSDKTSIITLGKEIMNEMIYQAKSDTFSLQIYSSYHSIYGFRTLIIFKYLPLWERQIDDALKDKESKEEESKKDL